LAHYFGVMGMIEQVNIRTDALGRRMGSIKFLDPTPELRNLMLNEQHMIGGVPIKVQTWKMQKLEKPGAKPNGGKGAKAVVATGGSGSGKGGKAGRGGYGPVATPAGKGLGSKAAAAGPYGAGADPTAFQQLFASFCQFMSGGAAAVGGGGVAQGGGATVPFVPRAGAKPLAKAGAAKAVGVKAGGKGTSTTSGASKKKKKAGKDATQAVAEEPSIATRYILTDLPAECTQEALIEYFSAFGQLEGAECKALANGSAVSGSVKFVAPTAELREQLLTLQHEIWGTPIKVQTWKMQKRSRPSALAKAASVKAAGAAAGAAGAPGGLPLAGVAGSGF